MHHLQLFAIDDSYGDSGRTFEVVIPDKDDLKDYLCGKHKYLWVTIENVIMDEPKELDLTKILKGCEGVTLWSDALGECTLEKIYTFDRYPIKLKAPIKDNVNNQEVFTKEGYFYDCFPNAKCLLWPSETNRDWSTFKKPVNKKVLKDGDYVMCGDDVFQTKLRQYFKDNKCYASGINNRRSILKDDWKYIIPFEDYDPSLSEEELKKLSIV